MTKYFKTIAKKGKEKTWKVRNGAERCSYCQKPIYAENDNFTLIANWKIKPKPDTLRFCSISCLKNWASQDEEEEINE